jgi:signal recognition particle GTPase
MFNNLKTMTGDTNDNIIKEAIQDLYDKIFHEKCNKLICEIRNKQRKKQSRSSKAGLRICYMELIRLLNLEFSTAERIKNEMNRLNVPNYSGMTGTWKISQVRKLLHVTESKIKSIMVKAKKMDSLV